MTTNTRCRSRIGSYFRANIPPKKRAKLDKQLEEFAVPQREARALNVRRVFYLAVSAKVVNKTEKDADRVREAVLRLRAIN